MLRWVPALRPFAIVELADAELTHFSTLAIWVADDTEVVAVLVIRVNQAT